MISGQRPKAPIYVGIIAQHQPRSPTDAPYTAYPGRHHLPAIQRSDLSLLSHEESLRTTHDSQISESVP